MLFGLLAAISTLVIGFTVFAVISDQNKNKMESQDEKSTVENMAKLPNEARSRPMIAYNVKGKEDSKVRENNIHR